jgi:sulfur relay (sulfurtransferase) DsrC/TusE family protein
MEVTTPPSVQVETGVISCGGRGMPQTRKISIRLTEKHYEMLELLVENGEFTSVSEAIRAAVKRLLEDYKEEIESMIKLSEYR